VNCSDARALTLRHLEAAAAKDGAALPGEVLDHIASCPHCLEDVAVLGAAVTGQPSGFLKEIYQEHGCDLLEQLLPTLVQSDIEGVNPAEKNPAAWNHLRSCSRCQSDYAELRELVLAAHSGELRPLPGTDTFTVSRYDLNQVRPVTTNDVGRATLEALGRASTLVNSSGAGKTWTVPLPIESAPGRGEKG
jgi:hypothetical protein